MKKLQNIILGRWFWLIALIVFSISRAATWLFPFDSDHWIFYYIGRRWIDGATLYVDMWDHKSPLIYAYNSFLHTTFGDNLFWHRVVFTLVALLALWLFYKVAVILFEDLKLNNYTLTARITTLLFAFFANLSQFTNSGNNNENLGLMMLLGTVYCYLLYRRDTTNKQGFLLASGVLAGFVFLLKANFAILLLPLLIDLIIINRKNVYRLIGGLAIAVFGMLLQLLLWALYFKGLSTFKQFYIATFEFNSKYIRALGWDLSAPGIKIFIGILLLLLLFFGPFLLKALIGFKHPDKKMGVFVPLLAASSILFIILAGTFYSHYFLITIPYLCLVFGATGSKIFKRHPVLKLITPVIIIVLMLLISLKLGIYNSYFGSTARELKNEKLAALYIKEHTSSKDTFFANTYGATFYELAGRNSGSRFISASHPLIDYKYLFGYDFNKTFIFDMEDSEAKYVVISSDPTDIYRVQNPVLMRYFNNNYTYETSVGGYDILRRTK